MKRDWLQELDAAIAKQQAAGDVIDERAIVSGFVFQNWESFSGSAGGGMKWDKLPGRMEKKEWIRPIFSFQIERHGATVAGSAYAEIQSWTIDLSSGMAIHSTDGRRRVMAFDAPLKVQPIAEDIAAAVLAGAAHPMVKMLDTDRFHLDTAKAIPETNKQTTTARRKRLVAALAAALEPAGWRKLAKPGKPTFVKSNT